MAKTQTQDKPQAQPQAEKHPQVKNCKHAGYRLVDGELLCANCGAPSGSEKWRANVFGAQAAGAAKK